MFDFSALTIAMRWLHLTSMAILVGGMIFARLVMKQSIGTVSPESRDALAEKAAVAYRPLVFAAVFGLVVSGIYKFLLTTGHSTRYHVLFGVKMLLALHVFSVAILIVQPKNPRRSRLMTGLVVSGLAIVLISACLGRIF
jgi:uncharacterized membrane protein